MQLITEAYDILKRGFGMTESEIADGAFTSEPEHRALAELSPLQSSTPGTRVSSTPTSSRSPPRSSATTTTMACPSSPRSSTAPAKREPESGPPSTPSISACPSPSLARLSSPAASLPSRRSASALPRSSPVPRSSPSAATRSSSSMISSRPSTLPRCTFASFLFCSLSLTASLRRQHLLRAGALCPFPCSAPVSRV